jgi:hypothetical protein
MKPAAKEISNKKLNYIRQGHTDGSWLTYVVCSITLCISRCLCMSDFSPSPNIHHKNFATPLKFLGYFNIPLATCENNCLQPRITLFQHIFPSGTQSSFIIVIPFMCSFMWAVPLTMASTVDSVKPSSCGIADKLFPLSIYISLLFSVLNQWNKFTRWFASSVRFTFTTSHGREHENIF